MTPPTRIAIVTAVREVLAELVDTPLGDIPQNANLKEDLDVDSLQQLGLAAILEERSGVLLDADDLSEVATIQDLADRVTHKLGP